MVKPISMAGKKITGLGEPTDQGDAVNKFMLIIRIKSILYIVKIIS